MLAQAFGNPRVKQRAVGIVLIVVLFGFYITYTRVVHLPQAVDSPKVQEYAVLSESLPQATKLPETSPGSCSVNVDQIDTTVFKAHCGEDSYICRKQSKLCLDFEPKPEQTCSSTKTFLELNEKRKQRLEKVCQGGVNYGRKLHYGMKQKEAIYFGKAMYKWCPSYKAATSNLNRHLCPLGYNDRVCYPKEFRKDPFPKDQQMWRNPKATLDLYRKIHNGESHPFISAKEFIVPSHNEADYTKFIVVRDPFTRALSGFLDKIDRFREKGYVDSMYDHMIIKNRPLPQHLQDKQTKLIETAKKKSNQAVKQKTDKGIELDPHNPYEHPLKATFPEFINGLVTGWSDPHFLSANNYCAPCQTKYDYIVKVDDFTCEFHNFLKATNQSWLHREFAQIPHHDYTKPQPDDYFYRFYSQLSYEQLDEVYDLYLEDCALFDFNCEETLCKIKSWKALHENN